MQDVKIVAGLFDIDVRPPDGLHTTARANARTSAAMAFAHPVDRHASSQLLAKFASAPEDVCALIFHAAGNEPRIVRVLRSSCIVPRWCRMRQAVVWAAVEHCNASSHQIARALNRDHSTVLYSYKIAKALLTRDDEFRRTCEDLTQFLKRPVPQDNGDTVEPAIH